MDPSKPILEHSTTTPGFLSGYWLIGTILAPFTLPWVLYKALGRLFYKYQRSSLDGKVSQSANPITYKLRLSKGHSPCLLRIYLLK